MNRAARLLPLFFAFLLAAACGDSPKAPKAPPTATVEVPDGSILEVELALTPEERMVGLMDRASMPYDHGMLFLFPEPVSHSFWMKHCRFPLDMLWLREDGTIAGITADVPPCPGDPCPGYPSPGPVPLVLEVNGGFAADHGLEPGMRLVIRIPEEAKRKVR